jgi:hypothetical protein
MGTIEDKHGIEPEVGGGDTAGDEPRIATDRHGYVRVRGMSLILLLLLIIAISTSVAAIQLVQIKCGLGGLLQQPHLHVVRTVTSQGVWRASISFASLTYASYSWGVMTTRDGMINRLSRYSDIDRALTDAGIS